MIDAVRVARERGFDAGRLIIAAVVDEEYASIGADALVTEWQRGRRRRHRADGPADRRRPQGIRVVRDRDRGTRRAWQPAAGRAGRDLQDGKGAGRLERLDRELQARPPHPVMGTASLHASIITGGREWSSYPDRCVLKVERRTVSGEGAESAAGEIEAVLDALRAADPEFEATVAARSSRVRPTRRPRTTRSSRRFETCARSRGVAAETSGNDVLDGCCDSWGCRSAVGAVRSRWGRSSQHRGIREHRRRHRLPRYARPAGARWARVVES